MILHENGKMKINFKKKTNKKENSNKDESKPDSPKFGKNADSESDTNYADAISNAIFEKKFKTKRERAILFRNNSQETTSEKHDEKMSISRMMKIEFNNVKLKMVNPESLDNYHVEKFVNDKSEITKNMEKY